MDTDSWSVRLSDRVERTEPQGAGLFLKAAGLRAALLPASDSVARRLAEQLPRGSTLAGLTGGLREEDRAELLLLLAWMERLRALEWPVLRDGREIALLRSHSPTFHLNYGEPPEGRVALSRFAYLRRRDAAGGAVLESGACRARLSVTAEATAEIALLAAAEGPLAAGAVRELAWRAGFLVPAGAGERAACENWEFHDRLFHETSRGSHEEGPASGAFWLHDPLLAPPPDPPASKQRYFRLPQPAAQHSRPLSAVMATRHPVRHYGAAALSLQQLSTLLYRALGHGSQALELAKPHRPCPTCDLLDELRFYLVARNCRCLPRGLYRYECASHGLLQLDASAARVEQMTRHFTASLGPAVAPPQALLIVTCRQARQVSNNRAIAYRLSLMKLGVVLHTLYLVATDLGLAACANGAVGARNFEEASGLDPWEEVAIGEFALGTAPDEAAAGEAAAALQRARRQLSLSVVEGGGLRPADSL